MINILKSNLSKEEKFAAGIILVIALLGLIYHGIVEKLHYDAGQDLLRRLKTLDLVQLEKVFISDDKGELSITLTPISHRDTINTLLAAIADIDSWKPNHPLDKELYEIQFHLKSTEIITLEINQPVSGEAITHLYVSSNISGYIRLQSKAMLEWINEEDLLGGGT